MAALTSLEIMQWEAPELVGASLTKNGSTKTLPQFFQSLLDSNSSSVELALAQLFRILALEDRNQSLTLGEFSFSRRTGMTFDERRYYWEMKYRQTQLAGAVPTIGSGLQWLPSFPVVR